MFITNVARAYGSQNRLTESGTSLDGLPTQSRKAKFFDDLTVSTFEEDANVTIDSVGYGWFYDIEDGPSVAGVLVVVDGDKKTEILLEDGWKSPEHMSTAELEFWVNDADNMQTMDSQRKMDISPIPFVNVAMEGGVKNECIEEDVKPDPVKEVVDLVGDPTNDEKSPGEVWGAIEKVLNLINDNLLEHSRDIVGHAGVQAQMGRMTTKVLRGTWTPRAGGSMLLWMMLKILHEWDTSRTMDASKEKKVRQLGYEMGLVELALHKGEEYGRKLGKRSSSSGNNVGRAAVSQPRDKSTIPTKGIGYVGEPESFADAELSESDADTVCSVNNSTDTESLLSYVTEGTVYKAAKRRHEQKKFQKMMERHRFGIKMLPERLQEKALYAIRQSKIAIENRGYTANDAWENVQSTTGKLRTNCELRKLFAEMTFGSHFDG